MAKDVHYLGIRHHGPGSARRVLAALRELDADMVLIEGPADLSERIPELAKPEMKPPLALLAYDDNDPKSAVFWPMATYSPEYQAALWALNEKRAVHFIDLPYTTRLAFEAQDALEEKEQMPAPNKRDPFDILGELSGYQDGESFWNDYFEIGGDSLDYFRAVEEAVCALREDEVLEQGEARREAFMRLEIARQVKDCDGVCVVICGAWHLPALQQKSKASDDRAFFSGLKKPKAKSSWVPWTSPRLSRASGYGAGVPAPKWYEHVWDHGLGEESDARWVGKIAVALREKGYLASTASLIEVIRLARNLAALRERPRSGFEEIREAACACLLDGQTLRWREIESALLLGNDVGAVASDLPLAPLLEDLEKQQKKVRLKPEALKKELSIDLRSDSGLARSTLLHRLTILNVPWGYHAHSGRSRGTFRENWILEWQPEYAVELIENLVHGITIETSAATKLKLDIANCSELSQLANMVQSAITAQLAEASQFGVKRLSVVAVGTDDCESLLAAIIPLVDTIRYGQARLVENASLEELTHQIVVQAAIALPLTARNLSDEISERLTELLRCAHQAILRSETRELDHWISAIVEIARSAQSDPRMAGLSTRLSYESEVIDTVEIERLFTRALSPTVSPRQAAAFFDGFFTSTGQQLIYDDVLRNVVDEWFISLDEDEFIETLPLMRRVFSSLDKNERNTLLGALLGKRQHKLDYKLRENADELWAPHMARLSEILKVGEDNG